MLSEAFTRALSLLMALAVPACVLLATLADPLIQAIYGHRWTPAAHTLSLLAIFGLMRVAYSLMYDCMAAARRQNALLGVQALWLTALIPVLLVGARLRGITGVAGGHLVVATVLVGPAFVWALSRTGLSVQAMLRAVWRPAAGVVPDGRGIADHHPPDRPRLAGADRRGRHRLCRLPAGRLPASYPAAPAAAGAGGTAGGGRRVPGFLTLDK